MLEKLKSFWNAAENKTNRNTIFWWILVWAQIAGLFIAYQAGVVEVIWKEDVTRLTSVILFVHVLATIRAGIDTATRNRKWIDPLWLGADQIFAIGILGTLCGFIILMHEAFANGIPSNASDIQKMLITMSKGMSTAFWVSACAIVSSMIQKIQVMNLEVATKEKSENE